MVSGLFQLLIALLAAAATGIVLWPLARDGKRAVWLTLVASLVVATLALYRLLGTPDALQPQATLAPQTLEDGIARLQAALERDPQRADGWALLARSQLELGRTEAAAASYRRAVQLAPAESVLLVEAAQARAQADPDHQFDDTALQWLQQAREQAPDNERAVWLIGIVQRQRGHAAQAAQTWETLLPRLEPGAAAALREQIDAARAAAGQPPLPAAPTTAVAENAVTVRIALDPDFAARARLRGDTTVFVIARIPGGPPMPVAVERHALQDLPLTVTLDDGDSPMPTHKLSALGEVEVLARLSASGNAMRQTDDLESAPVRVTLPARQPVEIVLGAPGT
ncbi:cytochrome C biogenesis protein [Stenotrophomonas sp. YIM B06876]|uniref:tetratricopeptide repeat protein n=1 Tax=Stenotrophomonas sp. YIM B06876 TaxID=3060211 RepID=UPI0027384AD3|nr:cytochrome C biogenesis protein [Stenotrophomonas sp. YIM B06876]